MDNAEKWTYPMIKKGLSRHSCSTCHCHIMKTTTTGETKIIRGLLQKVEVVGPVLFTSIRAPRFMDLRVPDPRPVNGTIRIPLPDGRELEAVIPEEDCTYFHVDIPKRQNPYLAPLLPTTLIGKAGKRRKRRRPSKACSDGGKALLSTFNHCRLAQRDREDRKEAKRVNDVSTTTNRDTRNEWRIQHYQAGANEKRAHIRACAGTADHW